MFAHYLRAYFSIFITILLFGCIKPASPNIQQPYQKTSHNQDNKDKKSPPVLVVTPINSDPDWHSKRLSAKLDKNIQFTGERIEGVSIVLFYGKVLHKLAKNKFRPINQVKFYKLNDFSKEKYKQLEIKSNKDGSFSGHIPIFASFFKTTTEESIMFQTEAVEILVEAEGYEPLMTKVRYGQPETIILLQQISNN